MLQALEEFNRVRATAGAEAISIGIGVNSGPVIAGAIGSSRTLQYTVIGDAVNLASRLCSAAKPGEVLVSETTMQHVRDCIEFEQREPITVKGKAKAVQIFRALSVKEGGSSTTRVTQAIATHRT
jgi:adenylate cyclase